MMNHLLALLQPYPFEKLAQLKAGITPPAELAHIALSIGEPKHAPPQFVLNELATNLAGLANYPSTKGLPELRQAIADWASTRFKLPEATLTGEHHVLPVAGTREALFSFTQACVTAGSNARVIMPNPFYQIYEGAAVLAGATPYFINSTEDNAFAPDFTAIDEQTWQDCQLLIICSPGNPTGTVLSSDTLQTLIRLADRYDFIIASDECYSELYFDEQTPPAGLLQACAEMGRTDYRRCVAFHSLSKRSNLPGLRSGFVAGDAAVLQNYLLYRTYHGAALSIPTQKASIAAWQDEIHVIRNRELYRRKFAAVMEILGESLQLQMPHAGFYLWAKTPMDDREFARRLFDEQNVTVLPGQFLARDSARGNPGAHRVRMALVATFEECVEAAQRIKAFVSGI